MRTDDPFQGIHDRRLSKSLVVKAKHYDADTALLLSAIQNLKIVKELTDAEKRELSELRQLRERVTKFIFTCGIKSMPMAGTS